MKKNSKKLKYISIFLFLIVFLVLFKGIIFNKSISLSINNSVKKLSAEREEVYDKMKVISLSIGERKTGTAPFNNASASNDKGVDVSFSDNYVRTFDKISYKLDVGIGPNTDVSGVENSSVFNGGVIKVRAKLPNQGNNTIMRWVKDAWMSNFQLSNNDTELYAEYIISPEESVTNAIQSLSFTVQVDGYKKEITDSMKPQFEVWMEGNKPDNESSSANLLTVKDNQSIIISGHPSYDVELIASTLANKEYKDSVYGQYSTFALGFSLKQDVASFNDLRGIEYPTGKITADMLLDYNYKDNSSYVTLPNGNLNGIEIIAYNKNMLAETYGRIYPENVTRLNCSELPFGKTSTNTDYRSVQDTGTITANLNNNKLSISIEDYVLNGKFPNTSAASGITYDNKTGYFAVTNMQLFIPFYVDSDSNIKDAKVNLKVSNLKYSTVDSSNNETGHNDNNVANDIISSNNVASITLNQQREAYVGLFYFSDRDSKYTKPDAFVFDDTEFQTAFQTDTGVDKYDGGTDNLIVWNPNKIQLLRYDEDKYYYLKSSYSMIGYSSYPSDNIKEYFGVYKDDKNNGPQTLEKINSAVYDDFNWYDNYGIARANGKVSAYYLDFPDNKGRSYRYVIYNKFKANFSEEDYGKTTPMRAKARAYLDEERTKVAYSAGYISDSYFVPTQYDDKGLLNYGKNPTQGETLLMIQAAANSTTTVSDKDSNNNPKKTYDVSDGVINVVVNPELIDGKTASNNDKFMNDVYVTTKLPAGLSYKEGSANKEPTSVTINEDGTTDIKWKYDNWQINHAAPGYANITFKSEISASLENNKELEIKTVTSAPNDSRDIDVYRTSKYKISITNLLGLQAIKSVNKKVVDQNESFIITSTIGNNSGDTLTNIKGIEFLPEKDDSNESKIDGTYTISISEKSNKVKLYYTTKNRSELGIETDEYGNDIINNVNLNDTSNWTEITTGDVLPESAIAVAASISSMNPTEKVLYKMQITPNNNKSNNTYMFYMDISSNNSSIGISSNIVVTKVIERQIKGIYFEDINRNNKYDDNDIALSGKNVKLYNSNNILVKETTTNSNGQYTFDTIEKNNYYIVFESNGNNYEVIPKGNENNNSKANSNYRINNIDQTVGTNSYLYSIDNMNIGVRKKASQIIVEHIYKDTNQVFKTETIDKYFGDEYNTNKTNPTDQLYEYDSVNGVANGTVNSSEIVVKYYYAKKKSSITLNLEATGTKTISVNDNKVNYRIVSSGTVDNYIGEEEITLSCTLPYEIDETNSNLDGGVYNKESNTIVWTINRTVNTLENKNKDFDIEKNIEVVYKDIVNSDVNIKNIVNVGVRLSGLQTAKNTEVFTSVNNSNNESNKNSNKNENNKVSNPITLDNINKYLMISLGSLLIIIFVIVFKRKLKAK